MEVTPDNRTIAKYIADAFGSQPQVFQFWDDNHESHVDIAICTDRPQVGVTSYSTIGLSDAPLWDGELEYPARVELIGACGSSFDCFENALATAAFCVINSKWFCFPGAIFPDVIAMYNCSETMQHFFFVPPFLWENSLSTLELPTKKVAWLMAVPISEPERAYAQANGHDRLEELFEERQIDIFNLNRPSEI